MFNFFKKRRKRKNKNTDQVSQQPESKVKVVGNKDKEEYQRQQEELKKQQEIKEERIRQQEEHRKAREERKKNNKNLSNIEFLVENMLNKATRGALDIQADHFEISYARIMSEEHKKRVIWITQFPPTIVAGHLELVRMQALKQMSFRERKDIEVLIMEHHLPRNYDFTINGKKLTNAERNFRRQRVSLLQQKNAQEANIKIGGIGYGRESTYYLEQRMKKMDRKIDSFSYIQNHQNRGGGTLRSYYFIEVTGRTLDQVDRLEEAVMGVLGNQGYAYKAIDQDLYQYMTNFGLSNINYSIDTEKFDIHPMTITTDVSALTTSFSEGIIRSPQGDIYMGHSVDTNYPVDISFSETADASNMLIVADSGSGKTVYTKVMALFSLMHAGGSYNLVVNDYKGGEWDNMLIDNGIIISMGIDNPLFINTLHIPDHKLYGFSNPKTSYVMSRNFTTNLITILTGISEPRLESQVRNICDDIVGQVYLNHGIDIKVPLTYEKSKTINFRESIWEALQYITVESTDMRARHDEKLLREVKVNLEPYFSSRGSKAYMFRNGVNIDEAMESRMIIFDYGQDTSGGESTMSDKEVNARIFQKDFFTTLFTAKNKLNGQYTMEIDEEVQRQLESPMLRYALNNKITGGRSSNKINILITNSVEGLLKEQDKNLSAIRDNINSVLIGRCKKNVMMDVIEYFELEEALPKAREVRRGQGRYKHSFICALNTGSMFKVTTTKMMIPKSVMETGIFDSKTVEDSEITKIG